MKKPNGAVNLLQVFGLRRDEVPIFIAKRATLLAFFVLCLIGIGCDRAAEGGGQSAVPSDVSIHDRAQGTNERESREELTQRLAGSYEKFNSARATGAQTPEVCRQLCDISTSICEMQEKICDIARRNPASSESVDNCRWAKIRCSDVSKHCITCTQKFQSEESP